MTGGRVPVTVLTGFLGAGKTTLLKRILTHGHGRRYGVIVNEFGEIGIDAELLPGAGRELVEMTNGCVCCTVRGDLVRAARSLLSAARRLDAIVVETTGLARPGPVAQTFLADAELARRTVLDSVTTVVDAHHVEAGLRSGDEIAEQIAIADQILLNKLDLVSGTDADRIESMLRRLNPAAPVHRTVRADVVLERILDRGAFDLARLAFVATAADDDHADHGHADDGEAHLAGIGSVSLHSPAPMDFDRLEGWLGGLLAECGENLLRTKGLVAIDGEDRRLAIQAVHGLFEGDYGRRWRPDEPRESRLVFIGRSLDGGALRAGFEACAAR